MVSWAMSERAILRCTPARPDGARGDVDVSRECNVESRIKDGKGKGLE